MKAQTAGQINPQLLMMTQSPTKSSFFRLMATKEFEHICSEPISYPPPGSPTCKGRRWGFTTAGQHGTCIRGKTQVDVVHGCMELPWKTATQRCNDTISARPLFSLKLVLSFGDLESKTEGTQLAITKGVVTLKWGTNLFSKADVSFSRDKKGKHLICRCCVRISFT